MQRMSILRAGPRMLKEGVTRWLKNLTHLQLQFSQAVARKLFSLIFLVFACGKALTFNQYFIHLVLSYIIYLWQTYTLPDTWQSVDNQNLIKPVESINLSIPSRDQNQQSLLQDLNLSHRLILLNLVLFAPREHHQSPSVI